MSSSPVSDEFSDVIDWAEAMEQCGDDEEFLRELLSDLRGEVDAQVVKIDEQLKGASSNLMCHQLREVASSLEQAAAEARENYDEKNTSNTATCNLNQKYDDLIKAVEKYHEFLLSVKV